MALEVKLSRILNVSLCNGIVLPQRNLKGTSPWQGLRREQQQLHKSKHSCKWGKLVRQEIRRLTTTVW